MSLLAEARKRFEQFTKEPILPILRTGTHATSQVRKPSPEVPPEFQITYIPPRKRR